MRRRPFLGLAFAATLVSVSGSVQAQPHVTIVRDAADPRWIVGGVTIAAYPNAVMKRLAAVDRWRLLFADIRSLEVVSRRANRWVVRFERASLSCGAHTYHVEVEPGGVVRVGLDLTGVEAFVVLKVVQLAPTETFVSYSMFVDTKGVVGWLIPEQSLRARQEAIVRQDLTDLARFFVPART